MNTAFLWFRARVLRSTRAHLQRAEGLISRYLHGELDESQQQKALIRSLRAIDSVERHLARQYWSHRCDAQSLRHHVDELACIRARLSSQPHAQGVAQTLRTVSNLCPARRQLRDLDVLCQQLRLPVHSAGTARSQAREERFQPRG
ncbi:hypothetical protein [Stenotrophomonas tumulicola]|uniref:Uncharacterized protein n=1 Tax=Stenotrophomonas tumulicola TaxID=1685415 RepID=A0A7W3FND8_9GAMM|nr:hypothetical protein [Stenotrophomonas tumulicola]MBA8682781.1 hypothetical protein [Stenotrophomonas tumulicola]